MRRLALRSVLAIVACACATAVAAPAASAVDIYSFANGCYGLKDLSAGRYVVKDSTGYATTAGTVAAATPFRLQATALGRYLLYGPDGRMPATGLLNAITGNTQPGQAADWRVQDVAGRLTLVSVSTGKE